MGRFADNVYCDPDSIHRIEQLANQLPSGANVCLTLFDGTQVAGVVAERPIVQTFNDGDGNEGINCMLRLEGHDVADNGGYLWLDQVAEVEQSQPLLHDATEVTSPPSNRLAP
ncbi:MAG TPA: DUF3247 family protein [Rhodanobacteraceae bacterium]|nr:DUF3247 family protein [Rhodanobacteraceae bacterium]